MIIEVAKDAGYCFGVRDAVNIAYDASEKFGEVYMLGDIVHNEQVVDDLEEAGAIVVDSINDIPNDKTVLLRAHGTKTNVINNIKNNNLNVIDATCPLVYEIHKDVKKLHDEGRKIIIIGDHGHDEVIAIADQVPDTIIVANSEEASKLKKYKRAGVVSQSTQMIENVQSIMSILMTKIFDLHFINTICYPTKRNHEQIKELAVKHDVMIVIGSFTSANSKRLTEIAEKLNNKSYQVTSAKDLSKDWFVNAESVGISAGASTPDYLIDEVRSEIEKISRSVTNEKR